MGRSNKLLARHKGSYQVIGKRQIIYIIEDLVKGKQIKTHVHNLRPFVFNPTQVNPLDVAQQNEQEFVVDGILAHRGDHHRRSTMEFLVRWAGYDESSNSWEPYKALIQGPVSQFPMFVRCRSFIFNICSRMLLFTLY